MVEHTLNAPTPRAPDHRLRLARLAKRASSTRIAYACNGFIGIHRLASLGPAALVIAALAFRATTEVSSGFRSRLLLRGALRNTGHTLSANRPSVCRRFANHTRPSVPHSMNGSSLARSMLMQPLRWRRWPVLRSSSASYAPPKLRRAPALFFPTFAIG
jgi:hypothetical protein